MKLNVKKLSPDAIIPTYATPWAAGADLYALPGTDIRIEPGTACLIHTGIAMEIPEGYGGFIYARSGLAVKAGLAPSNKVGVIDADYRGEIMVSLFNQSRETRIVKGGERIAQIVVAPYLRAVFTETDTLSETRRGESGFGSTGV